MSLELVVIVSNTLVILATFLATLYRIKIERDQMKTVQQDVKSKSVWMHFVSTSKLNATRYQA